MEYGDSSNVVKILQQKLKILGYYYDSITSSYGESTVTSVENFQRDNGYTVNGKVDLEIFKKIMELTEPNFPEPLINKSKPILKRGDKGENVLELQRKLNEILYYFGDNTGFFGELTENAVKSFQINNRLTSDGIVGKNTWRVLDLLYRPQKDCGNIGNEEMYIVKSGDTLYKIARENNISLNKIKELNNLTSDIILVGQMLKLPSQIIYTVKSGDSLYGIAQKFNTSVAKLKELNGLVSNIIRVGAKLLVSES